MLKLINRSVRLRSLGLGLVLFAGAASPAMAQAPFSEGAKCLFAGHSFFVPTANQFNALATANGFSAHEAEYVFASGASGSPKRLWDDEEKKAAIVDKLGDGDVELFGLTTAFAVGSDFEDYVRWIDLALSYNPDTVFYVGTPWVIAGPSFPNAAEFAAANASAGQRVFETVELLREAYPSETIIYIDYGRTASIMYELFEKGELPDIKALVPDPGGGVSPSEALFADPYMGHGGPMMVELSALTWLEILYGASVESLQFTDYETDVINIVTGVTEHNRQYAIPEPTETPGTPAASATPSETATLPPTMQTPTPTDAPTQVPTTPTPEGIRHFLPVALNSWPLQ